MQGGAGTVGQHEPPEPSVAARFEAVADLLPSLVWRAGPDGARTWSNRRWLELTGGRAGAAHGDGWLDAVHADDRDRCRAEIAAAGRRGAPFVLEYRVRSAAGDYRFVRDRGVPVPDPDGSVVGFVGIGEDLTAHRAAVDELRRREWQQELVAELGRAALAGTDDRTLLDRAVACAAEGLDVPLTAVLERRAEGLAMVAGTGWDVARLGDRVLPPDEPTLAAFTLEQDEPVVTVDARGDPRFRYAEVLRDHAVVSAVNVLIRAPGHPMGVLGAYTTAPRAFSDDDVTFLRGVANVVGGALARAAVEDELRGREGEARLAFSAGRMGLWRWDPKLGQVWWSPEMEDVWGLPHGSFAGTYAGYLERVHPDDRELVVATLDRARTEEREFTMQHRVIRPDGSVRTIEGRARPVRDAHGEVQRWIGVGIDVTDLARAEADLRARELETRLAFAAGRMGSWRWDAVTSRGSWSPELESLVGIEHDAFDGTWDAFIGPILAADGPMLEEAIGHAAAAQCEFAVQYRVRRADGGVRWVETRGTPVLGGREWIGVTIDVTEVRSALDAVRESRGKLEETVARLDSLLEHAPIGFAFFDRELRFVRLNAPLAEMNGISIEDHLGHSVAELLPTLWPAVRPRFEEVLDTGRGLTDVEVRGQTPAQPGVDRHWLVSYYPVPAPDGSTAGVGVVAVEITGRKRREREARMSGQAGELLVTAETDLARTLQDAADLMVPELADSCVVRLVPRPDMVRRAAVAHVDPELAARMREAEDRWPIDVEALLGARAETVFIPDVTPEMWLAYMRHEEQRDLAVAHGARSVIIAPMRVGSQLIGAMSISTTPESGRVYRREDVAFVEQLAARLALAIQNGYLAEDARRAQAWLDVLAELGELVVLDLDSQARLSAFAALMIPRFADACSIYLGARGGLQLAAFAAADSELQARVEGRLPGPDLPLDDDRPIARAFRSVTPVVESSVVAVHDPMQPDEAGDGVGLGSRLLVPLVGPRGPLGVVAFGYAAGGRSYGERDIPLAEEIARRMAPALEDALRFEREAATAEALQRSLLPERLPDLGSSRLAARYVPSGEGVRIGGDWYDAIPLPDGRVVLAIGDVVGHGVRAAAAMGRLRSVLQFCALEGLDPAATLERVNTYLAALAGSDMATLLVVEYDPERERLRYASAGHPPALRIDAGGACEFLDAVRGMPLGVGTRSRFEIGEAPMQPGSLVVLYTDGLVERRGESLDEGMARLMAVARRQPEDLEQLADGLLAGLLHDDRSTDDDVAVLVLRTLAPGEQLDARLTATPAELARMRRLVREWLRRSGASDTEVAELTIAINEVAANAIEHAYGLVDAEFLLQGRVEDGVIDVEVRDFGRWRLRTPRGERGRGLQLAQGLVDDLEVLPGGSGTTVRLRRRLRAGSGQDGGVAAAGAGPAPTDPDPAR